MNIKKKLNLVLYINFKFVIIGKDKCFKIFFFVIFKVIFKFCVIWLGVYFFVMFFVSVEFFSVVLKKNNNN